MSLLLALRDVYTDRAACNNFSACLYRDSEARCDRKTCCNREAHDRATGFHAQCTKFFPKHG